MEKQWAVWTGEYDNDAANWYEDHDAALEAWHTIAQGIGDGEVASMQRFDADGNPDEDLPHEIRRDGDDLLEYYNGERCWA